MRSVDRTQSLKTPGLDYRATEHQTQPQSTELLQGGRKSSPRKLLELPRASKPNRRSGGSTSFPKGSCARDTPVTATSSRDLSQLCTCIYSEWHRRLAWKRFIYLRAAGTASKHLCWAASEGMLSREFICATSCLLIHALNMLACCSPTKHRWKQPEIKSSCVQERPGDSTHPARSKTRS